LSYSGLSFEAGLLRCARNDGAGFAHPRSSRYNALRHCKEQSDEAIQLCGSQAGLLRCARNGGCCAQGRPRPQRSVPDGQITCPAPIEKINAFVFAAKHFPNRAVSSHEGALAIVTDAGRDAMDASRHF
jgi:hypothetical protein